MNIAFLLVVHKNASQINMFIEQLLKYEKSYVFIHIDKKWDNGKEEIKKNSRVFIIEKQYDIKWGDENQIHAPLELFKAAKNHNIAFDYYSLHSGQDLLIKPIGHFIKYLEDSDGSLFLGGNPDDYKMPLIGLPRGGFSRIQLNWPKNTKGIKNKLKRYFFHRVTYNLYRFGLIEGKKLPDMDFYKGSNWFTLPDRAIEYTLNYIAENPKYLQLFNNSMCCDEIFFHTILFNSPMKEKIVFNNYRYVDWSENKSNPKTFKVEDFNEIIRSENYFARKFDSKIDKEIIEQIISYVDEKEEERISG